MRAPGLRGCAGRRHAGCRQDAGAGGHAEYGQLVAPRVEIEVEPVTHEPLRSAADERQGHQLALERIRELRVDRAGRGRGRPRRVDDLDGLCSASGELQPAGELECRAATARRCACELHRASQVLLGVRRPGPGCRTAQLAVHLGGERFGRWLEQCASQVGISRLRSTQRRCVARRLAQHVHDLPVGGRPREEQMRRHLVGRRPPRQEQACRAGVGTRTVGAVEILVDRAANEGMRERQAARVAGLQKTASDERVERGSGDRRVDRGQFGSRPQIGVVAEHGDRPRELARAGGHPGQAQQYDRRHALR